MVLEVGGHLFAVTGGVGGDGDVVEFAVLIEAKAFVSHEVAAPVVDEDVLAVLAGTTGEVVGEIEAVDLAVEPDTGQ